MVRLAGCALACAVLLFGAGARSAPQGSPGCGLAPPPSPPASIDEPDGGPRPLIAVVPRTYDPGRPYPLVIAFHGLTNSNARVRRYYDLEAAALDVIFVYPSGVRGADGTYSWSDPQDPPAALRDYVLFDAILDTFGAHYCVDVSRVFAVGHSLGGWFASSLGCARGDRLRGVAAVGGAISASDCKGRAAAMLVHNPDDRLVDVEQGRAARDLFAAQNDAAANGTQSIGPFVCQRFGGETHPHPVLWCPNHADHTRSGRYYPHHWPPGTGAAIMSFFASLPRTDGEVP